MRPNPAVRRATLGVTLAVLLCGELIVRAAAPYLPPPDAWFALAAEEKARQISLVARHGPSPEVVFAGSSMMWFAMDPAVFTAADPGHRSAYNAALIAGIPDIQVRWLLEEAVPRLHPRTVVIGLTSFDLNTSPFGGQILANYNQAPATHPGALGSAVRASAAVSYLFRYKSVLRDHRSTLASVGQWLSNRKYPPAPRTLGPQGQYIGRRGPQGEEYTFDGVSATRQHWFPSFSIGGAPVAKIKSIQRDLRALKIHLVFVDMPVTDDFINSHPRGFADYALFERRLKGLADELKVPLIDERSFGKDRGLFADPVHMNTAGMREFSRALTHDLAALRMP